MRYLVAMMMVLVLLLVLGLSSVRPAVMADTEYFPGLRKPPVSNSWNPSAQNENALILTQLTAIIEEQARRRFEQNQRQIQHTQQILRQQQAEEYQQNRLHHLHQQPDVPDVLDAGSHRETYGSFTYQFPGRTSVHSVHEPIPFAIGPDDPRYYETSDEAGDDVAQPPQQQQDASIKNNHRNKSQQNPSGFLDDYEEMLAASSSSALTDTATGRRDDYSAISNVDGIPSYKLKAPMEIKPNAGTTATHKVRDDINLLVQKLQTSGQAGAIINEEAIAELSVRGGAGGDVVRKHMDVNTVVDMYVVAIIAGISATVTVGLVAIGIGWYTLHKKSMAAADVEYPAYGVTGPNKDLSPSGDRRLAQSAQMYHYQHQKQQIIAMENRTHNEHRNGSLTDAESDEENEEGDYTVYECPGLAPTGEMEVKNPLFLDDPTPATPANAASKSTGDGTNTNGANK